MHKILVSAGHSNIDPGAVANGVKEADIVADARNMLAYYLREAGHEVITDGMGKDNKPLRDAIKLIHGTDLAIELHCNAASTATAKGVESISLPPLKSTSQRISQAIAGVLNIPLRGESGWIDQSKSARGKLGFVEAGGIIVELFFISNPNELKSYQAKKWLVAKAIAGVINVQFAS